MMNKIMCYKFCVIMMIFLFIILVNKFIGFCKNVFDEKKKLKRYICIYKYLFFNLYI